MTAPAPVITNFKLVEKNTFRAVFDVELPSGLIIAGCQLHQKNDATWIGLPGRPYMTDTGAQNWVKIIDFRDRETRDRFQDSVKPLALAAYERARRAA